ncbi:MAG: cytochrome c oxidase accessory protein CcoG [Fibrobacteria bacterium]
MIAPLPSGWLAPSGENSDRLGEAQGTIGSGGKRVWLYPKEITGKFTWNRTRTAWALMVLYLGVPWLRWQGQPLILADWPGRKLVLLGNNFWAKDIPMFLPLFFAFILMVFFATARYGRLWCGWACPQTVFLQFVFAPIERFFEGKASRRKARDEGPWSVDKLGRKLGKHAVFAVVAWWIGNTALAYSWGAPNLIQAMAHPSAENWPGLALVLVFAIVFYLNFAFFREQACILVCPYARFQSVIPDENTSLIAYDAARGEKRGKGARGSRQGFGDCTDCRQCVLVCPTGIDIRQGQQLECIGCARCIDACDRTMAAWKKPTGLVRYASLGELQGKPRSGRPWRLIIYAGLALVMTSISAALILRRPVISVDATRKGSMPYVRVVRVVPVVGEVGAVGVGGDSVRNAFTLHLRNNGTAQRILRLGWSGEPLGTSSWNGQVFALAGGQSLAMPLEVTVPLARFTRGRLAVVMELSDKTGSIREGSFNVTSLKDGTFRHGADDAIRIPFGLELAGPWGR